jgi:hypothetical protein
LFRILIQVHEENLRQGEEVQGRICIIAHYRPNKKGIRITLRDNTDEIIWESWEARPKVRPGLYYVVENPGQVPS